MSENNITKNQNGLSLIELMIAMVLGLILTGGIINIFLGAKSTYAQQDALAQVQENARFALEFIARDVRMAGYGGCSNKMSVANTLSGSGVSGLFSGFKNGLEGYDGTGSTLPSTLSAALSGTDVIVIHSLKTDDSLVVEKHVASGNSATIHLTSSHSIPAGTVLAMVDANCTSMGVFMYSKASGSGKSKIVVHNTGGTYNNVSNCTKQLKGDFDCSDTSLAQSGSYTPGSGVYELSSAAYYLKNNPSGVPSLYRIGFGGNLAAASNIEEEIVEGISDMQITFGETTATGDKIQYKTANSVTDWQQVKVAKVVLTAQSLINIDGTPLVRDFVQTIAVRNREAL